MNEGFKNILYFLAGAAVGALGYAAVSRNQDALRPVVTNLLAKGMDLKDKAGEILETAKEGLEDLVAEAKHAQETRTEAAPAEPKA